MKNKESTLVIPQIITPEDYLVFDPTNTSGDQTLQTAINRSYLILDGVCGGQITRSYNVTDENDTNYRTEQDWYHAKQAFLLQVQYILSCGFDMSNGSSGYSIGGVSYNENRGNERKEVLDSVLNHLTMGHFYTQTMGIELTTGPNELNYSDCGGIGSDDPFWPWFKYVTYDVGDKRYITYQQPNVGIGYIPIVGQDHLVEWIDRDVLAFNSNLVNVSSYDNQPTINTLTFYLNNANASLVDNLLFDYQVNRLEGLIQAATPEGYDELVKQVQANTDAIGNINDVNEQQNTKIKANADNIELLNRNVVEIDYDGSMLDLNENTNPIASTTYVDEAIEANKGSNIAITYPENNSLLITDLTKGWGTSVENSGLYLHWQNNNNTLGWKNVAKEAPHNLTNDFLYIEGGKVKTDQIVDANSIVNRKYVQDSAQTIGQFLSQKPIIKYVKGGDANSGNTQGLYVYIPQSWAALPTEYWTNLYIVPVYYSTRAKNWKRGVTPRLLNARNMKLRIMTMPNGTNGDRKSPYYYLYNELWPTGRVTYLNDLKNLYIKLNNNAVGKWIRIATVDNATQPVKLSPYGINSFIFSWNTSIQKIQSMFDSDKNNWIKGRWNSGFRKHTHNNNGITKAYIEAYANVGWAFYRPSNTDSLVSGKKIFTELEALSTPTMVSMYFQAPYTSKPLNIPLYNYPQMKMTKIKID